jgi:predicted PurR-regulated permease PerM
MPRDEPTLQRKQVTTAFLLILGIAALYLCYVIAKPFLAPLFFAVMIAIVFHPVHVMVHKHVRNRNKAAVLTTLLVLVVLIVPTIGLGIVISKEVTRLFQALNETKAQGGGLNPMVATALDRILVWVSRYIDLSTFDLRAALNQWLRDITRPLLSLGAQAVGNVFVFIADAIISFFTLFFLFREGSVMRKHLGAMLPLTPSQVERLFTGISNSIVANVYGCLAVGLAQGLLTGLAFWVVGLSSPAMWGLVTGLFSMIPVIGSAAVWIPASIFLMVGGELWRGIALLIWGAAVVGQADNVVRPYVISQRANLHPLLVFVALLGGVKAFGVLGLFVGPVVLSATIVILEMLREANVEAGTQDHAVEEERLA